MHEALTKAQDSTAREGRGESYLGDHQARPDAIQAALGHYCASPADVARLTLRLASLGEGLDDDLEPLGEFALAWAITQWRGVRSVEGWAQVGIRLHGDEQGVHTLTWRTPDEDEPDARHVHEGQVVAVGDTVTTARVLLVDARSHVALVLVDDDPYEGRGAIATTTCPGRWGMIEQIVPRSQWPREISAGKRGPDVHDLAGLPRELLDAHRPATKN